MGLRRTISVCAAAFAVSGAMASQAFAEAPEFGRCVKVTKGSGQYGTSKCTSQLVGGSFEWVPGPGAKSRFTLVSKPATLVTLSESVRGTKITCSAEKDTLEGEYTGPKTVRILEARISRCTTSGGAVESAGEPEGVVVLKQLTGVLGISKKGESALKNQVSLDLSAESGGAIAEFACNGLPLSLQGSVISHALAANSMTLAPAVKFEQLKGRQKPEGFEGTPKDVLEFNENGGPFEQAGLEWLMTQTNEEKIEVNTVV